MQVLESWRQHRIRWIVIAIGIVILALLIALIVHVLALLQPQRFTSLLERDLAGAGIRLEMQAPAKPALFPRPAVRMQGFSVSNAGSTTPILQASSATIVVPWRALLHGEVSIQRIEVDAPRIDLGELRSLFARLPHRAGPPRLPTIAAGVHMSNGTLTNGGTPLLFELSLDTGELVPGHRFQMDASARSADGSEITASLDTVPSALHDGVIDFDPIHLTFGKQGGVSMQLDGQGHWQGGEAFALQLHGTLRHPSLVVPPVSSGSVATSASAAGAVAKQPVSIATDAIALDVQPANAQTPLTIAMKLDGDDAHGNFKLQPTEFRAWWQKLLAASPDHPPGPLPFNGQAEVKQLDLGWLKATGLRIDAGPDLTPAPSASVVPPAAAASTSH